MLRRRGYNVIEAEDGLEGLLKAGGKDPDLVLLDLALPEMDGVEVARRLHEMPKLSQIPIFVISAYLTEEIQADLRALGRVGMSRKPFDADVLLENIRVTLSIHR